MHSNNNLEEIKSMYEMCDGDMELTKQTYKYTYGTQITNRQIKKALASVSNQAEENLGAVIKEEVVEFIDIETEDEEDIILEDPLAEKETNKEHEIALKPRAIVYTTRLEDMDIFKKDFNNIPLSSIVKKMAAESKPKLIIYPLVKKEGFESNSLTFGELVNQLEVFNNIAAAGADTLRNAEGSDIAIIIETEPDNTLVNQLDVFNDIKATDKQQTSEGCDTGILIKTELENALVNQLKVFNNIAAADTVHNEGSDTAILIKTKPENTLVNQLEVYNDITPADTLQNSEGSDTTILLKREPEIALCNIQTSEIEICKQLRVVLVDCKPILKVRQCAKHQNIPFTKRVMQCKSCIKYYRKDADVEPQIKFKFNKMQFYGERKIGNVWVVMKNIYSNVTEICKTLNSLATSTDYYEVDHIISDDEELSYYIPIVSKNILEYKNCCWIKRNKNIQTLWSASSQAPYFWLKAHPCPFNKCTCCCNNETVQEQTSNMDGESSKDTLNLLSGHINLDWQQKLSVTGSSQGIGLINKALNYCRKQSPSLAKLKSKSCTTSQTPPTSSHQLTIKVRWFDHHFNIGPQAQINSYSRQRHNNRTLQVADLSNVFCCWVSQNTNLKMPNPLMLDALNFIRTPHDCPPGACKCCCRKIKTIHIVKQIEPQTAKYKKYENFKPQIASNKQCHSQNFKKPKQQRKVLHKPREIAVEGEPVALSQTAKAIDQKSTNVPVKTSTPVVSFNNIPIPKSQDPTVSTLIATILDRFKNIRLSLNPEGKIIAELDTPVAELSNDELKILSNILSHAQEQVNTLGVINNTGNLLSNPNNGGVYPVAPVAPQANLVTNTPIVKPQDRVSIPSNMSIPGLAAEPSCSFATPSNPLLKPQTANRPSFSNEFASFATPSNPLLKPQTANTSSFSNEFASFLLKTKSEEEERKTDDSKANELYDEYARLTYMKNGQYRRSLYQYLKLSGKVVSTPIIERTFSLTERITQRKRKSILEDTLTAKVSKQLPDIKMMNVAGSDPSSSRQGYVQVIPDIVPTLTVNPLVPFVSPIFVVNNQTNVMAQPVLPVPSQIISPFVQPVLIPTNLNGDPPVTSSSFSLVDPSDCGDDPTAFIPGSPDIDEDCILGV